MRAFQSRTGFTVLELQLVVAIMSILSSTVMLAVDPARNLAQAYNSQRWMDVNGIMRAVQQYEIDNGGKMPATVLAASREICRTEAKRCIGMVDLTVLTAHKKYLTRLPVDPVSASENGTGYFIFRDADDRVNVTAPFAQLGSDISINL